MSEPHESKRIVLFMLPFLGVQPLKYEIKLTNYFLQPIHIFKFVAFFDLCKDFRLFSALKIAFL